MFTKVNDFQGLFGWRDLVARAEDESTGYILPNKTLLEIGIEKACASYQFFSLLLLFILNLCYFHFLNLKARQMPVTTSKLRRLLKAKHPYVERNLGPVVNIIKHSILNAAAFEAAAQHLKEGHIRTVRPPWT